MMPLPSGNYNDPEELRDIAERLRGLAVTLENRKLRIRHNEPVSPLGSGPAVQSEEDVDNTITITTAPGGSALQSGGSGPLLAVIRFF